MDLLLRIGGSLIGIVTLVAFLRSILRVAMVNRRGGDWLARHVGWLVYTTIARMARGRRSYDRIQDTLAWILPIYMLLLIVAWFALAQTGFSLLIWSSQAEHSLLQAVIASGSALSTLGFLTPPDIAGQLLAIPEGATGLGIVVFFFTFIPGYQTAIQSREIRVAWLYARSSAEPINFGLVEWFQRSGKLGNIDEVWEDWEAWFRNLIETHTLAPVLAFVPTVHRNQTWLIAATAILDAASFCISALDANGRPAALLCHTTGVRALRLIALELADRRLANAAAPERPGLTRSAFDACCDRLTALEAPVKANRDESWRRFTELRAEYEIFLPGLAASLLVPMDHVPMLGSGHC